MAMPARIQNLGGEPYCCESPCSHNDCAAIRERIGAPCAYCGKGVARGSDYSLVAGVHAADIAHYLCAADGYAHGCQAAVR